MIFEVYPGNISLVQYFRVNKSSLNPIDFNRIFVIFHSHDLQNQAANMAHSLVLSCEAENA